VTGRVDTQILKDSFAAVAPQADELVRFFYADLFYRGGEDVIAMFPPQMSAQRDRLLRALMQVIADVDDLDKLSSYLSGLGRDHRKFDVQPQHYDIVGASLLATLAHFAGDAWTPQVAGTWKTAYGLIASVMQAGAEADKDNPPWWDAVVTSCEHRGPDIAILEARLSRPMAYAPGQSVAVQFDGLSRVWRFYSPAHPPLASNTVTFHIKIVDGGAMSTALAMRADTGDRLRLGPPVGTLRLDHTSGRDIAMIAGSTGLAPLLAMVRELALLDSKRRVHLFFGAAEPEDLYELDTLRKLAAQHDWLTVTHAVTASPDDTPGYEGEHGSIVDVAAAGGPWEACDVYICGPSGMVEAASGRLMTLGVPGPQIHIEDFG
jgi:NAD(P)H-flavin reductase/hemoglobin-like flavoprotein